MGEAEAAREAKGLETSIQSHSGLQQLYEGLFGQVYLGFEVLRGLKLDAHESLNLAPPVLNPSTPHLEPLNLKPKP